MEIWYWINLKVIVNMVCYKILFMLYIFLFFFLSLLFLVVYDLFLKYGKNSCMCCMDNNKIIYSISDNLFLFIFLLLVNSMK